MKIIYTENSESTKLPMQVHVSFEKVIGLYQNYASKESHPFNKSAKAILKELKKYPELNNGFSDIKLLRKYDDQIDQLLGPLFPELLTDNEIKAVSIPFSFTSFKFSRRFENILKNAGDDYHFKIRNYDEDSIYIQACVMILSYCYGYKVDLRRPFFFDIPDHDLGVMKHYRIAFNGDFAEVIPTDKAINITEKVFRTLLDNFDNIEVWKKYFPPESYILKGFGIMNLFDVTLDQTISAIKANLLKKDANLISSLEENLRVLFNIKDLSLGFSVINSSESDEGKREILKSESLVLSNMLNLNCDNFFCDGIAHRVFKENEIVAIQDVEAYGKDTDHNDFYKALNAKGIGSIILVPIRSGNDRNIALMEIASPRAYELNSVSQNKLRDIVPVFKSAIDRTSEERQNVLEATIQENYTAIHPSVKWRFYQAAERYQNALMNGDEETKLDNIVFEDVFPLFAQHDIKGSSTERNTAIQEDLTTQLDLAIDVLSEACDTEDLPIYEELMFRVKQYLDEVKKGLNAGDEVALLDFLKRDIYPVFNHVKNINDQLESVVEVYMARLDPKLMVVYEKRKAYEESVNTLNETLAGYIDKKQEEAQKMFPHYFERYVTDGVEYNMYIGQSMVQGQSFDQLYLFNLRLWQLQLACEVENVAYNLKKNLYHQLRVATLILVHSNPLAIKFRMDEKQFDVDGAYNVRYEIIKKRIDKAYIKGTTQRLTEPGKIAIVYSQDKDVVEYMKYIGFLQAKGHIGNVQNVELEDLQGVSGLKALRADVIYHSSSKSESIPDIEELMSHIELSAAES